MTMLAADAKEREGGSTEFEEGRDANLKIAALAGYMSAVECPERPWLIIIEAVS